MLRRQEAWRIRHKVSKAELNDLAFLRCAMNFASDQSVREVLRAIVDGQRFRPDLIIIDTLFSSLPGVNVSDQKEMTLALERIEFVQKTLEAVAEFSDALAAVTIVVIAHTTKDGASLFGTVAIPAIFDVMIKVEREAKAREAILHYTEARDIEEPPSTKVVLEEVEIDTRSGKEKNLYRLYATTRNSSGEMIRKLSEIRSRKRSHFLVTVRLRKRRIADLNCAKVS